jgi:ClpP class serine protease
VEKVLNDFGQGDVFVGQAAIDAGLADRLGSFEETVSLLAEAHGPASGMGYTGALHAEDSADTTEFLIGANTSVDAAAGAENQSSSTEEDEFDPETNPETDPEVDETDEDQCNDAAIAPVTTEKGAISMAQGTEQAVAGAENQPTVEQLQAALAEANEKAAKATERITKLEASALTGRLQEKAAGFTGDVKTKVDFMQKLVATFGEESDELKAYVADQNALAEQLKAGGLFKESGSAAEAVNEGSAYSKLEAAARRIATENNISFEQAMVNATDANPELYKAYINERG